MSNVEIDLTRPLLANDELAPDELLLNNQLEEESTRYDSRAGSTQARLGYLWRRHKRRFFLILPAAVVAILLAILLLTVNPAENNTAVPEIDEKLAYDPRLDKYAASWNADACPRWSLPHPSQNSDGNPRKLISTVSFSIPPSTNLTFFVTRGRAVQGNFIIHKERTTTDEIDVQVVAEYDDSDEAKAELAVAKACMASHEEGATERGVMIWADPRSGEGALQYVQFNISVHLPSIGEFQDFSTDFTNSLVSHNVADFFDIWSPTVFGSVRFNAQNSPMIFMSMLSHSAFVSTSNAPIDGSFWVTDTARIQTDNARVRATVWALGHEKGKQISTFIRTANAPVLASLTIASDFTHVKLNASVHTSNAALQLYTPGTSLPYPSVFVLNASTSNAPAILLLHNEFEGTFNLRTSAKLWRGAKASVEVGKGEGWQDPAQKGRQRVVGYDRWGNEKKYKSGKIFWGEEPAPEGMGEVRLVTTGKDVTIRAQ